MRTRSRLADIDQPLVLDRNERDTERQIRAEVADHRRQVIKGKDPRGTSKPPWRMKDARPAPGDPKPPAPPRFRVELDSHNCIARLTQIAPDPAPSLDSSDRWSGRKFRLNVKENCSVPEGSLRPGAVVEAFAHFAFDMVQCGRAEILEEFAADGATA